MQYLGIHLVAPELIIDLHEKSWWWIRSHWSETGRYGYYTPLEKFKQFGFVERNDCGGWQLTETGKEVAEALLNGDMEP